MKRYTKKNILIIGFIILSLLVIIPVLIYASMSVPAADDFSNAYTIRKYWKIYPSTFIASLVNCYDYYFESNGFYFSIFLNMLFQPLLRWGIGGLRIFNVIVNIAFFTATLFLFHIFVKEFLNKKSSSLMTWFLYSTFVFSLINNTSNFEVYTWYCVLVAYTLPLALMMCTFALFILILKRNSHLVIITSTFAFLVSGSSLNIVALNCGMILLFGIYGFIFLNKKKESLTVFISALVGAIINVVAPGNYIRRDYISTNYDVIDSFKDAIKCTVRLLIDKCLHTSFLPVLIIIFLISYIFIEVKSDKIKFKYPIFALIVAMSGIIIVNFPVTLGYESNTLPVRCVFIQDIATYFLLYLCMLYFIGWLKTSFIVVKFSKVLTCAILTGCILLIFGICRMNGGYRNYTTGYMISSIVNGELVRYVKYEEGILEEIENSEEEDVIIYRPFKMSNPYMKEIGIESDPQNWVNKSISGYYYKDSTVIYYTEE